MKIVILQGAFLPVPPKLGGAVEKMWYALGKDFAAKGHEVIHISRTFPDMPKEEWIDGVCFKRVSGYNSPSSGLYLKFLDFLYTSNAIKLIPHDSDVIITNTFWSPILLPSKLKERCVVDVQRMPKGQFKWYKGISRYRANSTPVATAIKKELNDNVHHKVIMIPNPLPFNDFSKDNSTNKKKVLLYTGRIHPEKGLDHLLRAFAMLKNDWQLKIVGPWEISQGGGGTDYLLSLKKIAENANVEFVGPVFNIDKLNEYYSEASIFIYPSVAEKGETFGLAPLEAMAWGCVPVVSNLSCFTDFITHGYNGLIFDHRSSNPEILLRNEIEKLQTDSELRNRLSNEAINVRNTHSTSHLGSEFIKEFEKIKITSGYPAMSTV